MTSLGNVPLWISFLFRGKAKIIFKVTEADTGEMQWRLIMISALSLRASVQGLASDFENACPKQQFQDFCLSIFSY